MSRYQKGKTNLNFTEARDSEWQWQQLGHMQVCISLQTDNHASTPPLSFLQAGCPSCRPTNSVKALKANNSQEFIHNKEAASVQSQIIKITQTPFPCVCPAARVSTAQAYSLHMVSVVQDNVECSQHPALMYHLISNTNIPQLHMYTYYHNKTTHSHGSVRVL